MVVKIDLLEGRTAVASVEKLLIELRGVLFHHRGDLVVHEILHTAGLLELFHRLFAHDLRANRAASGHQLLEGLCLELNDGLGQHWMGRACRATEWLGALFHAKAQQVQALGVHRLPVGARTLVCLEHGRHIQANLGQDVRLNDRCQVAVEVDFLGILLAHLDRRAAILFDDDLDVRLRLWDASAADDHLKRGQLVHCFFDCHVCSLDRSINRQAAAKDCHPPLLAFELASQNTVEPTPLRSRMLFDQCSQAIF